MKREDIMIKLLDCTLRDGANVVGKGFSEELTVMMLEGLIQSNVKIIEMGNTLGLGSYEINRSVAPLTDNEYLSVAERYSAKAEIGMFMLAANAREGNIAQAAEKGLSFLRVGASAGDGRDSLDAIKMVKKHVLTVRYSLMKAYVLTPKELAKEAAMLEEYGLDEITIMDSAGTMLPEQVKEYVAEMAQAVSIPIAFHGHNNLALSAANAIVAAEAGASVLDCGLMGMARSAGNLATEVAAAVFLRRGELQDVDLYGLLALIDEKLAPAMLRYDYRAAIYPTDLVYGLAGCHSGFAGIFERVASEKRVPLYPLIARVSAVNQKNPSITLIEETADKMKNLAAAT